MLAFPHSKYLKYPNTSTIIEEPKKIRNYIGMNLIVRHHYLCSQ